jgi:hypothetical protein
VSSHDLKDGFSHRAGKEKQKLASQRVRHPESMTQPALGGAQCCGEQRGAEPSFASRSAFLEEFAAKRRGLLGTSQENLRNARDRSATPKTKQRAPPAALVPPRQPCPFIPYGCQKQPVMTYGTKEARPLGAGRRRAGSPVWEWINDHWHASAPHLAPIHPPLRATHPSRAMDRKTVFYTGGMYQYDAEIILPTPSAPFKLE